MEDFTNFKLGDKGVTLTNLRPEGKAIFGDDERITVYSIGEFIDKDAHVTIVKIEHNKIFVTTVN